MLPVWEHFFAVKYMHSMRVSLGPERTLTTCWLALQHALLTQPVRPIGFSDLPFSFTSYHITRTSSRFGTGVFMMILPLFHCYVFCQQSCYCCAGIYHTSVQPRLYRCVCLRRLHSYLCLRNVMLVQWGNVVSRGLWDFPPD